MRPPSYLQQPIAVLGAGSWGTALAAQLARNGNNVRLWGRSSSQVHAMRESQENASYIPGIKLPDNLSYFDNLEQCLDGVLDCLVVCVFLMHVVSASSSCVPSS